MVQIPIGLAIVIAGALGIAAGWDRMQKASRAYQTSTLPQRVIWLRFSRGMLIGSIGCCVACAGVITCFWDAAP